MTDIPYTRYTRFAGGPGLGWSRQICTDNAAMVAAVIGLARTRGDAVESEANGVIRVDGAGVYDPSFPLAGEAAPVWFVPQP